MKKFLLQTCAFALVVLMIIGTLEVCIERTPNPYRYKHEWMERHSKEVRTLILGSSHAYYGICPAEFGDDAFSLANTAQTLRYDLYLLSHYEMPNLRTVILPYSYFTLWEDCEAQGMDDCIIQYRRYMGCDIHSHLEGYDLECFYLPSFREKAKGLFLPRKKFWDQQGWGLEYTIDARNKDWDDGESRATGNTYIDSEEAWKLVKENAERLDSIANICKEHNAHLILVHTPVSGTFTAFTDSTQNAVNERVLRTFLSEHPDVKYIDADDHEVFNDDDFYDADHLNQDGARKLSKYIIRHCKCVAARTEL